MREMEHCIPRAHLSQVISYCFRQLLIPLPAQEFSCNANVMVRPTNGNCKSRKNGLLPGQQRSGALLRYYQLHVVLH